MQVKSNRNIVYYNWILNFFFFIVVIVHATLRDNIELRPHQVEGVNQMIYMEKAYRGGILADEMGLGKVCYT